MNFDEKINIIYGDNAQGKTNILESMYVCATSKSHRGSKDREIIRFDNDESHIKVNVKKNDMNYRIDMHLKKNKPKGIAVNGIPIKRAVELFGILNIVFFSPEDLNIIKNGPSERRRFIDMELSQLDKIYLDCLINYNKVVNQRNSLLKEYAFSGREDIISSLDIWDMHLGAELALETIDALIAADGNIGSIPQSEMIDGGLKKKARQNKALVDEISATIILQSFLESKR